MEDKTSFYEFLVANSKINHRANDAEQRVEPPKVKPNPIVSFLVIFLINVLVTWAGWNLGLSPALHIERISLLESAFIYSLLKVVVRGFVSVQ